MSAVDPGNRGPAWEAQVSAFLSSYGWPVRPVVQDGRHDRGDLEGLPDFVVQCKDHATYTLAAWADDAERQRKAAAERFSVVVVNRRGRPVSEAYAVLPLVDLASLLYLLDVERGFLPAS